MPKISRNIHIDSLNFEKGMKTSPINSSGRELKIPSNIHFSNIQENLQLEKGFRSQRNIKHKRSSFLKGNLSNVSLSLQYKIKELKRSRRGFWPEMEMQNKRIHQTITKNK